MRDLGYAVHCRRAPTSAVVTRAVCSGSAALRDVAGDQIPYQPAVARP